MSLLPLCGVQPIADFIILGACQVVRILVAVLPFYFFVDLCLSDPGVLPFAIHAGELGVCEGSLSACVPVLSRLTARLGISTACAVLRRCVAILGRLLCGAASVAHVWIVVP